MEKVIIYFIQWPLTIIGGIVGIALFTIGIRASLAESDTDQKGVEK